MGRLPGMFKLSDDPATARMTADYLRTFALVQPLYALAMVVAGAPARRRRHPLPHVARRKKERTRRKLSSASSLLFLRVSA